MPQIAIIEVAEFKRAGYYDDYDITAVVRSITDWSVVTDHEYELIKKYLPLKYPDHQLITRLDGPLRTPELIIEFLDEAKKEEAERQAKEARAAAKRAEKKKRDELKAIKDAQAKEEAERNLLKELQEKYGN